jgi:hypothetical protein
MTANEDRKVEEAITSTSDEAQQIDAIAKIRGWFKPDEDSKFYGTVQEYLNENSDPADAVKKLLKPIDDADTPSKRKDINVMDLWFSIIHSAKRIPLSNKPGHQKLVELLQAIKTHPESANAAKIESINRLGSFGMAGSETGNDSPGVGAGFTTPETHACASQNFFFALITKNDVFDFWRCAIYALRSALEEKQRDDGPHDAHIPGTAVQKYNALVPSAAAWIFALGRELFEKEEDLTPTQPGHGNPGRGGELWKGRAEFSKERWALWKSRFEEIAKMEEVSEETRQVAHEAVAAMKESEGS